MQFATIRIVFGLAWFLMGFLWLRRAYIGEKAGVFITLRPSSEHLMTHRERMMALFLGASNLLLGIAELVFARK